MIQLDLNNPEFQANWLALAKPDEGQLATVAVLKTLRLLQAMSWEQLPGRGLAGWPLAAIALAPP